MKTGEADDPGILDEDLAKATVIDAQAFAGKMEMKRLGGVACLGGIHGPANEGNRLANIGLAHGAQRTVRAAERNVWTRKRCNNSHYIGGARIGQIADRRATTPHPRKARILSFVAHVLQKKPDHLER